MILRLGAWRPPEYLAVSFELEPIARPPFRVGDPAPVFEARATNNDRFMFGSVGGRYIVLCFYGSAADQRSRRILELVVGRERARFDDVGYAFFGVSVDPADEAQARVRQLNPGVRFFWDFDGAVTRLYAGPDAPVDPAGAARAGFTVVLDPFMSVLAVLPFEEEAERHAETLSALFASLPPPHLHAGRETPAPVLVLPRVLEPELCRTLIDLYETRGGSPSGFMQEVGGKTVGVMDDKFKRRNDLMFDQGEEFEPLRAALRARIARRLAPAIQKSFQFRVSRIERFLVACYDAEGGGYFRAHRDNTTLGTAHRQFAVTINLNADQFEGGELCFPEFGPQTYRPPTGGAVVFACGLLHEARPVTRGRRYAFLPFLYNEEGAVIRRRNQQHLSGETIDQNARARAVAGGANVS